MTDVQMEANEPRPVKETTGHDGNVTVKVEADDLVFSLDGINDVRVANPISGAAALAELRRVLAARKANP